MPNDSIFERGLQDHILNPRRGHHHNCLQYDGLKKSDDVEFDPPAGRVMRLNADGELVTGVTDAQVVRNCAHAEPVWLMRGLDEFSNRVPGLPDPSVDKNPYTSGNAPFDGSVGVATVFLGRGDFILETTEFISEAALSSTYAYGDLLTAIANDTDSTLGGKVTKLMAPATLANSNVIGYVGPEGLMTPNYSQTPTRNTGRTSDMLQVVCAPQWRR